MKRLLFALVLLWPVTTMGGAFYSGNDIQERCACTKPGEPNANMSKHNFCVAYLSGVSDTAETLSLGTTSIKKSAHFTEAVYSKASP